MAYMSLEAHLKNNLTETDKTVHGGLTLRKDGRRYYPFYFVPFSKDSHKCVNKCEREIRGTAKLLRSITLPLGYVAITRLEQMPRAQNSKGGSLK